MLWIPQRDVWIYEGELVKSLALKEFDDYSDEYSVLNIYYVPEVGGVFFAFEHTQYDYCPLKNFYWEDCSYRKKINIPCYLCPDVKYLILSDEKIIPVNRIPENGI